MKIHHKLFLSRTVFTMGKYSKNSLKEGSQLEKSGMRRIKRGSRESEKKRHPIEEKGMERKISVLEHEVKELKKEIDSKEEEKIFQISVLQRKHELALQKSRIKVKKLEFALQIKSYQEDIAMSENLLNRINQTVMADPLDQRAGEGLRIHFRILESRKERYYDALMEQMRF